MMVSTHEVESDAAPRAAAWTPPYAAAYWTYIHYVGAWLRFEAALAAGHTHREGRGAGPTPTARPDLAALDTIKAALDAAYAALREAAGSYAALREAVPRVPPLDMLDDLVAVGPGVRVEAALAWLRTLPDAPDAAGLLTTAFAAGRYVVRGGVLWLGLAGSGA